MFFRPPGNYSHVVRVAVAACLWRNTFEIPNVSWEALGPWVETVQAQGLTEISTFGAKNKTWWSSRHPEVESRLENNFCEQEG